MSHRAAPATPRTEGWLTEAWMAAAWLVLGACTPLPRPAAPPPPGAPGEDAAAAPDEADRAEERVAAMVDEALMQRRVRELVALGPRMGGTASGERAATYVEEAFAAAGLATRRIAGEPAWCHEETAFSAIAVIDGERRALARAWPLGFSPSSSGRVPLALEPRAGAALLCEHPPRARDAVAGLALVLADGSTTPDGEWPVCRAVKRGLDHPVFGISRPEGALLREALAAGRAVEVEFALDAVVQRAPPVTVVASLPARPGAEAGYFLFCAHGDSDSGGPGANDNGSGVAIVLEIARVWAAAVRRGVVPAPPREMRFAVWGSEIASTRHYLAEHAAEGGPLLGVLNYDQAGFGSSADQLNVEPDDLPANVGLVRELAGLMAEKAGRPGFPARWATNKSLGGTDSYVFSGSEGFAAAGRPAVTLYASAWSEPAEHERTPGMPGESWSDRDRVSVDFDNYYHSAGDRPENTTDREPWNMGWCVRVGLLGALRWLERGTVSR